MPQFIAPQLCKRVSRPPVGEDWVHEIKLDGYRMQLRVADGEAVMRTRKGLDWTEDFSAIAKQPLGSRIAFSTARWWRWTTTARRISRRCKPPSRKDDQGPDLLRLRSLHAEGDDLRRLPLTERKERLQSLLKRNSRAGKLIKYVEHLAEPGDAVLQSACRLNLEGIISKCASAPYQSGRTEPG